MHRFFVEKEQIKDGYVTLVGSAAHYFSHVLRLEREEIITAFDGRGNEYKVKIDKIEKEKVSGAILKKTVSNKDTLVDINLVQGIPKGEKMDLIVQKCTELGVSKITPVLTERTIVKLNDKKRTQRKERWQRIAQEAAKQSKRFIVPEIADILTLKEFLKSLNPEEKNIILWEEEKEYSLRGYLRENRGLEKLNVFIGPEGGFSEEEVNLLRGKNGISITLGRRILRTETAGLAALTMILYDLGDLG